MDIWQWVHDYHDALDGTEHERLVELMDDLSSYTCANQHTKVDAIYPEALQAARAQGNPWAEVYVRHWYLQSQVLHRCNGQGMLDEAVDLLAFSSQETTKDCPQSICVVQDLASCYTATDAPGFLPEIEAVCQENIDRINPTWPCYECITEEHLAALNSVGEHQKALALESERKAAMVAAGSDHKAEPFARQKTVALAGLGEYRQALDIISEASNWGGGLSFIQDKKSLTALCHALLGEYDKAQAASLSFDEVLSAHQHFVNYSQLRYLLVKADAQPNDSELNRQFNIMVEKMLAHGAIRDSLKICHWQAELALMRDDLFTVGRCIAIIEDTIGKLNKDLGAQAELDALRQRYMDCQQQSPLMSQQDITDLIEADNLPALSTLEAAATSYEDDERIVQAYVQALAQNGYFELMTTVVDTRFGKQGLSYEMLRSYCSILLEHKLFSAFDGLLDGLALDELDEDLRQCMLFYSVRRYFDNDAQKALAFSEQFLVQQPHYTDVLAGAGELSTRLNQYTQAVDYYQRAIDSLDEPFKPYWWDMLVPATINGDWAVVRQAAKALELDLVDESGPVNEDWGPVRLKLDNDEQDIVYARRLGPVHAKVTTVGHFYDDQFLDDVVVFDAAPLNALDQQDEEGNACDSEGAMTHLFKAIHTIEKGDWFFLSFDGVYPSDAEWQALEKAVTEAGFGLHVMSNENYEVYVETDDCEEEETMRGIYGLMTVPGQMPLASVKQMLMDLTADYQHPLAFSSLAKALGCPEFLASQLAIIERYGLD